MKTSEPRVWVASGGTREQLLNNPLAALLVAVGDRIVVKTEEGESDESGGTVVESRS